MKRFYRWVAIGLVLFAGLFVMYLLNADMDVPEDERNTAADPSTFMDADRLQKAEEYTRIRYILYFLNLPYEWGLYLLVLGLGVSKLFQRWSEGVHRWPVIQVFFYLLLFTLLTTVAFLPFRLIGFFLGHYYGVTTQSFHSWMEDVIKGYWVELFLALPVVWFLFWIMKKSPKRWWMIAWTLSIPFILFVSYIQPVVLDPIFNEFHPLQDRELKGRILELADRADIPANQVFEVNMSEKTNAMNAYVTGIGGTARIVLWDTTLNKLEEKEILFIMAHEMGHYVMKHVFWSILGMIALVFVFLWFLNLVLQRIVSIAGRYWGIERMSDLAVFPLILLLASVLSFVASPLTNWVSRVYEHQADVYALEMTEDPDAAITSFQKLSAEALSHPNPPALIRFFLFTHPTIVERIRFASQFEEEREGERDSG